MPNEFHITIDGSMAKQKVTHLLASASGLSQQQLKQAMQKGAVWLESHQGTRRVRRADTKLRENNILHFYHNEQVLAMVPPTPQQLADECDYSVWYKPTGMLCQGSKWSDHCTINRWIETQPSPEYQQRNCFIVHRLDKAACGLILIAHTKQATQKLAKCFEEKKINKHYRALVEGNIGSKEHIIDTPVDNKPAYTIAKPLGFDKQNQCSLLDVEIKTGRKHQIRIHMSQLGHPIIGDRLHGSAQKDSPDLQLQSFSLSFTCPISHQERQYQCPESLALTISA